MSNRIKDVITKLHRPPREGRQLIALSRADAERIPLVTGVAMISITAPEKAPAQVPEYEDLLRLSFADVDFLSESLSTRAAAKIPFAMTKKDGKDIITFVEALPSSIHTLLVHCEGGFSRSCGVVKALHQLYGYEVEDGRLLHANQSVRKVLLEAAKVREDKGRRRNK